MRHQTSSCLGGEQKRIAWQIGTRSVRLWSGCKAWNELAKHFDHCKGLGVVIIVGVERDEGGISPAFASALELPELALAPRPKVERVGRKRPPPVRFEPQVQECRPTPELQWAEGPRDRRNPSQKAKGASTSNDRVRTAPYSDRSGTGG